MRHMRQKRVVVVFFSAAGMTAMLAEAVAAGIGEAGADAVLLQIMPDRIVAGRFINNNLLCACDEADALVFGSPTYMGGPAAQFKAFADATSERWGEQRWAGKVAGGFTTGACANGDQGHTLAYFTVLAAQHGMLWCGLDIPGEADPDGRNRLGSQLGLATHAVDGKHHPSDLATARYLGARLAKLCSRFG